MTEEEIAVARVVSALKVLSVDSGSDNPEFKKGIAELYRLNDKELAMAAASARRGHGTGSIEAARLAIETVVRLRISGRGVEQARALVDATGALRESLATASSTSDAISRSISWRVALFTFGGSILAAALASVLPALVAGQLRPPPTPVAMAPPPAASVTAPAPTPATAAVDFQRCAESGEEECMRLAGRWLREEMSSEEGLPPKLAKDQGSAFLRTFDVRKAKCVEAMLNDCASRRAIQGQRAGEPPQQTEGNPR